jgi:hypothetical protein
MTDPLEANKQGKTDIKLRRPEQYPMEVTIEFSFVKSIQHVED